MTEPTIKRLKQGKTMSAIIDYLIERHPKGLKRSEIQGMLLTDLGVGESTGGVNRQLKRLRQTALIDWDQDTYTYTLPQDFDNKEYFIRIASTLNLTTDQAHFMSLKLREKTSEKTATDIDDYLGFKYDQEMNENIMTLQNSYKMNEIKVHDTIAKMQTHHNSYVRLRLFKTSNECFIRDLTSLDKTKDTEKLIKAYAKNIQTTEEQIINEKEQIFKLRENLIKNLNEKRLSTKMKFLIRFALNAVRPSHIYDGMI